MNLGETTHERLIRFLYRDVYNVNISIGYDLWIESQEILWHPFEFLQTDLL